jgi:hypothetical protein
LAWSASAEDAAAALSAGGKKYKCAPAAAHFAPRREYSNEWTSLFGVAQEGDTMQRIRKTLTAMGLFLFLTASAAAEDWGRFYHYPYSYFPVDYRRSFRSADFNGPYGYPAYPMYMAFPPYFRKDLFYPYHRQNKPGNNVKFHSQGNHYVLDVF